MIKFIFLGIIQGLTEFLPVSSSGHLVLLQRISGIQGEEVALSLVLHLGTILSLVVFFAKDILRLFGERKKLLLIALVTFVTGIIGIAGKGFFESTFTSVKLLVAGWLITGIVLILTKGFMQGQRKELNFMDALFLGLMQASSIIPSISRSGMTVPALLFRKIEKEEAFRFSFLASIPAILGAVILEAKDIAFNFSHSAVNYSAGFLVSFVSGVIALWFLQKAVKKAKLHYFGYYCILIAIITLIFVK